MSIGKVSSITLNRKDMDRDSKVEVTIAINKKTRLPKGTIAKLTSIDLLGTKGITLDLGTSDDLIDNDAMLPSSVEGGLVDKISVEVTPLLQDVRKVVNSVDSVLLSIDQIFSPQARTDLQQAIAGLHTTTDNFAGLSRTLNGQSAALARVIQNADKIAANLSANNGTIDQTLKNLRATSDRLSKAKIDEMLNNVDQVAANLNEVVRKINSNEGSLGLLVNDKNLYNNLNSTLAEFSRLSADLKAHPSRYINLTVFGRKARVGD